MSANLAALALQQPSNGYPSSAQPLQPTAPVMLDSQSTSMSTTNGGHSSKSPSLSQFSTGAMSFASVLDSSERFKEPPANNSDVQSHQAPNYNNLSGTRTYPSSYGSQHFVPRSPVATAFTPNHVDTRVRVDPNVPIGGGVRWSTVVPGSVYPSEVQLAVGYAYAIQRADGKYTRLVPADETLIDGIPTTQGPEGLIVLPPPRALSPGRRQGNDPVIPIHIINQLATEQAFRPKNDPSSTQRQIDSIINESTYAAQNSTPRRQKVYCDKWIHEGVCAFTQVGCKYKHEMPHDKATQLSLGLNHGLPNWYRRHYGSPVLQLQSPQAPVTVPNNPPVAYEHPYANLHRLEDPRGVSTPSSSSAYQAERDGDEVSAHGPISQPPSHRSHPAPSGHAAYIDRSRYPGNPSQSSQSSSFTYPGYNPVDHNNLK